MLGAGVAIEDEVGEVVGRGVGEAAVREGNGLGVGDLLGVGVDEGETFGDGVEVGVGVDVIEGVGEAVGDGVGVGVLALLTKIFTVNVTGRKFALSSGVNTTVKSLMPPGNLAPRLGEYTYFPGTLALALSCAALKGVWSSIVLGLSQSRETKRFEMVAVLKIVMVT